MAAVQQAPPTGPNFMDAMEEEMRRCTEHLERRHIGRSVPAKSAKASPPGDTSGEGDSRKRRPNNIITRHIGEADHNGFPSTVLYAASSPAAHKPSDVSGRNSEGAANSTVVGVTTQREEEPPVSIPAAKRVARPIKQNTFPRTQAASMDPVTATEDDGTTEHKSVTVTIPANRWNTMSPDRAMSPTSPVNPSSPVTLNPAVGTIKSYSANRPQKPRTVTVTSTATFSGTLERAAKEEEQRHTAASEGSQREGLSLLEKVKAFESGDASPVGVYRKGQRESATCALKSSTDPSSRESIPPPMVNVAGIPRACALSSPSEVRSGAMALGPSEYSDGIVDNRSTERREAVLGATVASRQKDSIGSSVLLGGGECPIRTPAAAREGTLVPAMKSRSGVEPMTGSVTLEPAMKPRSGVDPTTAVVELSIMHQDVQLPGMNQELNTKESPIITDSIFSSSVPSLDIHTSTEAAIPPTTANPQEGVLDTGGAPLPETGCVAKDNNSPDQLHPYEKNTEALELRSQLELKIEELAHLRIKHERDTSRMLGVESREAELRLQTAALEAELRQQKEEMEAGLKLRNEVEAGLRLQLERKEAELVEVRLHGVRELERVEEKTQKELKEREERWTETSQQELKRQEELMKKARENTEQELKEREEQITKLTKDNNRLEREKWELLRRARDAAERMLGIRMQLEMKEGLLKSTQAELTHTLDELSSVKSSNTGLRTLLAELRASRSGVDEEVQVNMGGPLQRNRSIEMALNQGMCQDVTFNISQDVTSAKDVGPAILPSSHMTSPNGQGVGHMTSPNGQGVGHMTSPNGKGVGHMTSPNGQGVGHMISPNGQGVGHMTSPNSQGASLSASLDALEQDSGVVQSPDFHVSSSTLDNMWSEREPSLASVSSSTIDSRESTPVAERLGQKKKKTGFFEKFDKLRKSKRGSGSSVDGLDLSHSSLIQPAPRANAVIPIGFPYATVLPHLQDQWKTLEEFKKIPFPQWNGRAIIAWLEAGLGMNCYVATVREHVTSGHAMLALSLSDIEKRLGISNPLHRRKLWLAIEEQRNPDGCLYPCAGKIDHHWVAGEWATECGLQHLSETLLANMVDGRVLNSLCKDDLKRHLKITKKLDQLSFTAAVELLRMHEFNREAILEHRRSNKNPLYWSNRDVCDWLHSLHLEEYADYVLDNSIHGALLFLERGTSLQSSCPLFCVFLSNTKHNFARS
eukprot:Em0008g1265a